MRRFMVSGFFMADNLDDCFRRLAEHFTEYASALKEGREPFEDRPDPLHEGGTLGIVIEPALDS